MPDLDQQASSRFQIRKRTIEIKEPLVVIFAIIFPSLPLRIIRDILIAM